MADATHIDKPHGTQQHPQSDRHATHDGRANIGDEYLCWAQRREQQKYHIAHDFGLNQRG